MSSLLFISASAKGALRPGEVDALREELRTAIAAFFSKRSMSLAHFAVEPNPFLGASGIGGEPLPEVAMSFQGVVAPE